MRISLDYYLRFIPSSLSPLMIIQFTISFFFFISSIFFFLWVLLFDNKTKVETIAWTMPKAIDINKLPSLRFNSDADALTRPVFYKTRRQNPNDKLGAMVSENINPLIEAPANLVLVAITKFKNIDKAFVKTASSPEGAWFKLGDRLDDWFIKKIEATSIIIMNGNVDARIDLYATDKGLLTDKSKAP
jgi:hypothetical protein